MKEDMFYIDGKGILPKKSHSKERYIAYGKKILEISTNPKQREQEQLEKYLWYEFGTIRPKKIKQYLLKKFEKKFNCDVSWINAFIGPYIVSQIPATCGIMDVWNYKGVSIPVVLRSAYLAGNGALTHELIHAIRINVQNNNALEEAYADRFAWIKGGHPHFEHIDIIKARIQIKEAEKKLEDIIGDKKRYVSIRLKGKEIRHIANTQKINIINYLKSQKTLRHRIITERLGL